MRKNALSMSQDKLVLSTPIKNSFTKLQFAKTAQQAKSTRYERDILKMADRDKQSRQEEEYIKGLQEEIKLLEYELKLLKDKALNEKNKLNEYDVFMSDDLDINENILAIKTKYLAERTKLEERLRAAAARNQEEKYINQAFRNEIKRNEAALVSNQSEGKEVDQTRIVTFMQLRDQYLQTRNEVELISQTMKGLNEVVKSTGQKITKIKRAEERDVVLKRKREDQEEDDELKFRIEVQSSVSRVDLLVKQNYDADVRAAKNQLVKQEVQQIQRLKKRLILVNGERAGARQKVEKVKAELDDLAAQRKEEQKFIRDTVEQVQVCVRQEAQLEKGAAEMVQAKWREYSFLEERNSSKQQLQFRRKRDLLTLKIQDFQENCSAIIREKDNLRLDVQTLEQDIEKAKEDLRAARGLIRENGARSATCLEMAEQLSPQVDRVRAETQNLEGKEPLLVREIGEMKERIEKYFKEVALIKELRRLNLEEVKLIASGKKSLSAELGSFISKSTNILREYKH